MDNKIVDYCSCPKGYMEGVAYPRPGDWHKENDILIHDHCGKPVHACNFCSIPAFGVLAYGYACKKHIGIYIKKLHNWQDRIGAERTQFEFDYV